MCIRDSCNFIHLNRGLYTDWNAALLQAVCHCQAIDDRGQHPHMVRPCALHPAAAVLDAAPEVAAAYHNTHLDAQLDAALNHIADAADHIKIQATRGLSSQGFAADLQQHPLIFRFFHVQMCIRDSPCSSSLQNQW